MNTTVKSGKFRSAFQFERVICRIIASWSSFAAAVAFGKGSFADLAFAQDLPLWYLPAALFAFFLLYSLTALFLPPHIRSDSWFLLASAGVCVCRWMKTYDGHKTAFLIQAAMVLAFCLFLFYFLKRNADLFDAWKPGTGTVTLFVILCGVFACSIIAVTTCLRYLTFTAPNFDFGLFCNMFHHMKESGLPMVTSERDQMLSHFAVHISPIYYLLLPFYFLFPSPMTLQIGQAVVVASGIIPVVLLARHFKLSGKVQMVLALLYALNPAVTNGCFYDIHENCFLIPLLLWMFYFFERQKYVPMYLFAVGVLMVKEDAAMYIILFALFVLLSRKKYLHGSILLAAAVGYFMLTTWLLDTYGTGVMTNRFDNLIFNEEDGLLGAVKTALFNPGYLLTQLFTTGTNNGWEKFTYFLQMLLPLGMLPFCTGKASRWLLITPILMNMLTNYVYQYNINFQYNFGICAFLFYAVAVNLPELHRPTRNTLLAIATVFCCCLYITMVLPRCAGYITKYRAGYETYQQMEEILDTIPSDASVNVTSELLAHIADRDVVFATNFHGNKPDVDYVVLDARFEDRWSPYYNAYFNQGYRVYKNYENLIIIMKKP